ncbi:MAG: DNRLRE domain-containing protein, partial [Chitinophagaceae bacterium]
MKTYKNLLLLCILASFNSVIFAQTRLKPIADGYIYLSGGKMNSNFGTSDTLITRYTRKPETTAQTFIRFDLKGQPGNLKTVTFNISGKSSRNKLVDVFSAFGEWTDNSLKGGESSKPSRAVYIGTFELTSTDEYHTIDITPYINSIRSSGKQDLTLVLAEREVQEDADASFYHAKENNSGKAPFLSVETGNAVFVKPANRTYYVDAQKGNDKADGRSPGTAWKTLKKVESVFLQQGDRVLFKRGGIFKGSLFVKVIPSSSGITKIGTYGKGERPRFDAEGKESFCLMIFNTPFIEVGGL